MELSSTISELKFSPCAHVCSLNLEGTNTTITQVLSMIKSSCFQELTISVSKDINRNATFIKSNDEIVELIKEISNTTNFTFSMLVYFDEPVIQFLCSWCNQHDVQYYTQPYFKPLFHGKYFVIKT